jgi:hypothetical protein
MNDFDMPEGLSADGVKAYEAIKKHLNGFDGLETGGCTSFYSPTEWARRGESYGKESVLIVVYDGGDLRPYFNMDAAYEADCLMFDFLRADGKDTSKVERYSMIERTHEALRAAGFFVEECTGWHAAVYKL